MSELFEHDRKVEPVWNVIPQFFKYPFKPDVLPSLALVTFGSLLTLIPLIGLIALIFVWMTLFKVSYEILQSTASGRMDGPPSVTQTSGGILFKHIGLLLLIGFGYVFIAGLTASPVLSVLLGLFVLIALPAAVMTLAMTESLLAALNPATWVRIMKTTGLAYVLTSVFVLFMLISQSWLESIVLPLVGNSLLLLTLVSWAITSYFMAASFHLMGYLLYQFHDELGIESDVVASRPEPEESNPLVAQASEMVRDGRPDDAVSLLSEEIERHGAEVEVHEFYRRLLHNRGDQARLAEHARTYIPVLLHAHENVDRAVDVARESLAADRDFRPREPADILPLARHAFQRNQHRLVLDLSSGFGKRHPRHPDLPELYFLAAQSLVETSGKTDKATRTVQQLIERFPDHPLVDDMRRFEQSFRPAAG